jgi:hypothetical protein
VLRDRLFEDAAECINIQARLCGIRHRHYNRENVEKCWNEYLEPRLERKATTAAEAAAEETRGSNTLE